MAPTDELTFGRKCFCKDGGGFTTFPCPRCGKQKPLTEALARQLGGATGILYFRRKLDKHDPSFDLR